MRRRSRREQQSERQLLQAVLSRAKPSPVLFFCRFFVYISTNLGDRAPFERNALVLQVALPRGQKRKGERLFDAAAAAIRRRLLHAPELERALGLRRHARPPAPLQQLLLERRGRCQDHDAGRVVPRDGVLGVVEKALKKINLEEIKDL